LKRSTINQACREASDAFKAAGWNLPSTVRWDVTDCGLGAFERHGIVLVNLAEEKEYCEKLIYMRPGQAIPAHTHGKKKEDIVCRSGELTIQLWNCKPGTERPDSKLDVKRSGQWIRVTQGKAFTLAAGERVTLVPGTFHSFWASAAGTVIGEVSTANDDENDNIFADPLVKRHPEIEEDEPASVKLVGDLPSISCASARP
jgi:D-lyxose ketol-isomerase